MSSLVVDRAAVKTAARAAIVIAGVFAFADKVIGNQSTALFAAFGSFALLVLAQFRGPPRTRLLAYLALGCVGAAFYTLGTLCSRSPWLATSAMAVVGFGTLFSGVFSGYFSAGSTAAILTFVLPATVPAANSAIPDRLAGWGLATGAAICAVTLLWPPRRSADLQREAADGVRSVADVSDADPDQLAERGRVARDAVQGLERRLLGTQRRPTGPTGPLAALASLPGELDWLLSLLLSATEPEAPQRASAEDEEAMAAAAAVLRAAAERLEGREARPDFARLDAARDAVARALVHRLPDLVSDATASSAALALEPPFRIRAATYSARQVAGYALRAAGPDVPELDWPETEPQPARAVLVIAIGTHEGVLWAVLPVALLLAAYAPRAISFAVGQAGFTVFVLVLFNLLAPVGWRVGLVRVEDVAIGFAISLGVGLLFWPRGAAALVRQDLALRRLDETFRQYLGERSATRVNPEDIAALVGGASRVRRAAQSLTTLARMANGDTRFDRCGQNLDRELQALQTLVQHIRIRTDERWRAAAAAHPRRGGRPPASLMRARCRPRPRQRDGQRRARPALGQPTSRQPLPPRNPPQRARERDPNRVRRRCSPTEAEGARVMTARAAEVRPTERALSLTLTRSRQRWQHSRGWARDARRGGARLPLQRDRSDHLTAGPHECVRSASCRCSSRSPW